MLLAYIEAAMKRAQFDLLEDGLYFGEIPGLQGLWSAAADRAAAEVELRERLEEWILTLTGHHIEVPELEGINLNARSVS